MLKTAFDNNTQTAAQDRKNRSWSYIGRFIWGFTMLEYQLNQLFQELLGGGPVPNNPRGQSTHAGYVASLLLTYTLDLRKKMDLIQIVLKSRGIDESGTFKRINALHDLRNIFAHWPFDEDLDGSLWCDFVDKHGNTGFHMPGTRTKDNHITFEQLDSYDVEASKLHERVEKLLNSDAANPITDVTADLQIAIEKAVTSSDNVVRFPT